MFSPSRIFSPFVPNHRLFSLTLFTLYFLPLGNNVCLVHLPKSNRKSILSSFAPFLFTWMTMRHLLTSIHPPTHPSKRSTAQRGWRGVGRTRWAVHTSGGSLGHLSWPALPRADVGGRAGTPAGWRPHIRVRGRVHGFKISRSRNLLTIWVLSWRPGLLGVWWVPHPEKGRG